MMSKIRGRDNRTERAFRRLLWALGCRYRLQVKNLPGRPDLVFRAARLAVFVDGDFWHGRNWAQRQSAIQTNRGFWIPKIERNRQRDREVDRALEAQGWQVLRFWESEIREHPMAAARTVLAHLEYGTAWREA
jgi:DNA mismatch endonuclease (patch repair protein)